MECKYCSERVTGKRHACTVTDKVYNVEDSSDDFLISAVIGAATNSALLGGLLGGDMLGGLLGDFLNGKSIDD
jgi:hypothetical protein